MHPLDIIEERFVPEPIQKGRTVVCAEVMAQDEFEARVGSVLDQLGLIQESHGLTFYGCAVTFSTEEEAALFRMFYEGDTINAC